MRTFLFKVDDPIRGFNMTTMFAHSQEEAAKMVEERFETKEFKFVKEVRMYDTEYRSGGVEGHPEPSNVSVVREENSNGERV